MQQIFNFVIKNKTFLLFLLLFSIALALTIQSHSYHRSKFINSANGLTGGVYGTFNSISQYFDLKDKNAILTEENNKTKRTGFQSRLQPKILLLMLTLVTLLKENIELELHKFIKTVIRFPIII